MYFGGPYLVGLYLAGGVVGSLAHVAFYSLVRPSHFPPTYFLTIA